MHHAAPKRDTPPATPRVCTHNPSGRMKGGCGAPASWNMRLPCGHLRPICESHATTLRLTPRSGACGICFEPCSSDAATWTKR